MPMSDEQFQQLLTHLRPADGDESGVGSLSIKLPTFWTSEPDMWFFQIEAVFNNRTPKVTKDSTKFNQAVAALPQDVLLEIRHVMELPVTDTNRFRKLKEALVETFGKDDEEKRAELLRFCSRSDGLGDRKPINLLMHIRHLAGNSYEALERAMFLNQLPAPVRTALANSTAATNEELAREAGKILREFKLAKSRSSEPHVTEVRSDPEPSTEVSAAFAPQRNARQPLPPSSTSVRPYICYPHSKYGTKAFACKSSKCAMRGQVAPRPVQGNGNAGR